MPSKPGLEVPFRLEPGLDKSSCSRTRNREGERLGACLRASLGGAVFEEPDCRAEQELWTGVHAVAYAFSKCLDSE